MSNVISEQKRNSAVRRELARSQRESDSRSVLESAASDDNRLVTLLAKLVKNRGFARGDFELTQGAAAYVVVTNIQLDDASISDKGMMHELGTFFHVHNVPSSPKIQSDEKLINRIIFKNKMRAVIVKTEEDDIAEVADQPPSTLNSSLKNMTKALITKAKALPTKCDLAPKTLKDALTKITKPGTGRKGDKYKKIPPNVITTTKDGKQVYKGSHIEHDADGGTQIIANGAGITLSKEGAIEFVSNKIKMRDNPDTPHAIIGMQSKDNAMREFNPGTFAFPAGLGPLSLKKLPDFSVINWILKLYLAIEPVTDLIAAIDEKAKTSQALLDNVSSTSQLESVISE